MCKSCEKVFSSTFSCARGSQSNCFDVNRKLVEAFLKMGKGHAGLEIFSMVMGAHATNKKIFANCLRELCEEKEKFKDEILEFARNIVRAEYEELDSMLQKDTPINITVSYDGT